MAGIELPQHCKRVEFILTQSWFDPATNEEDFDYDPGNKVRTYCWDEFIEDPNGSFLTSDLWTGGDYAGDTITRANFLYLKEEFGQLPGVHAVSGGWSSYTLAISIATFDYCEELRERLFVLDGYPLANEEYHSELEMDLENMSWEEWIKGDFEKAAMNHVCIPGHDEKVANALAIAMSMSKEYYKAAMSDIREWQEKILKSILDRIGDSDLFILYKLCIELANEYPIFETGCTVHVNVDKIAEYLTFDMLADAMLGTEE